MLKLMRNSKKSDVINVKITFEQSRTRLNKIDKKDITYC